MMAMRKQWALFAGVVAQDADVYPEKLPTTRLGCQCAKPCETSVLFSCNADEFCTVANKDCPGGTAQWSLSKGHYDWCVFEPHDAYEAMTAAEKQAILLRKLDGGSGNYPSTVGVLTGILGESVRLSFDASADVFPHSGRTKYIHSVGVAGGIKFESNGAHPYTGAFEGAEHGIVRFSSAKEPGSGGFTPGMGVKFLRDGRPSANFVSMYTLDGQGCEETNFFEHDWSNHIPMTDNFGLKIVAAKFWQASYCPLQVGLSDVASPRAGSTGKFPYQLIFKSLVDSECDCLNYEACLSNLAAIAAGTPLFEVFALATPGAEQQSIGTVTLTSQLTSSKFGDEQLFFKHQYMEDDFTIHPEWLEAIDKELQCGMSTVSTQKPDIEMGCTSPFNSTTVMLDSDTTQV